MNIWHLEPDISLSLSLSLSLSKGYKKCGILVLVLVWWKKERGSTDDIGRETEKDRKRRRINRWMHNVYRYTYTTNANYRLIAPDLFQVLWKTYSHVLPGKRLIRREAQVASWQTAPINKHSCAKPWLYHYENVSLFCFYYLPLEKNTTLHLNKLESRLPMDV